MTNIIKIGSLSADVAKTSARYTATTDFYSYDNNVGQISADIKINDAPLIHEKVSKIRLTMVFTVEGALLRRDYLLTPTETDGLAFFNIPQELLGYVGTVQCGLTIDFKDGSTADAGTFTFSMKKSLIDAEVEQLEGAYSQEFQEILEKFGDITEIPGFSDIPTKLSQLQNDSGFVTATAIDGKIEPISSKLNEIGTKVETCETNVSGLNLRVTNLSGDLTSLDNKVTNLTTEINTALDVILGV